LQAASRPQSPSEIQHQVEATLGHPVARSSIQSMLNLNKGGHIRAIGRGRYALEEICNEASGSESAASKPAFKYEGVSLHHADCIDWLNSQRRSSIHAVVTDPPYGILEYTPEQQRKLREGVGGVWRIPPSFDGAKRSPLPRFTVLGDSDLERLRTFFRTFARALFPVLVPGAHIFLASNPLLSYLVATEVAREGFERRGEVIRLVTTMRGGDRPKNAHHEFASVSVMPRSMWEPWLLFRKPIEGRVQDNLRRFGTGALRRPSVDVPFGDVIRAAPASRQERAIAPHPTLKPQTLMRRLVHASLPLGEGMILDPFAGSGSTLAAAVAVGYQGVGVEIDLHYLKLAEKAIPALAAIPVPT
jgi:site-specific DNA-methyltransferase (adenine-specific)